jgi:hypothetical protein
MGFLDGIGGGDGGGGGFDMSSLMSMFGGGQGGSSSAGGASGGGGLGGMMGGGMSGLMDPAGILSGGNPLDRILGDLGKVENFLGINKKSEPQANPEISKLGQQMLDREFGNNHVSPFGDTQNGSSVDAGCNPATTELPANSRSPGGFAPSPGDGSGEGSSGSDSGGSTGGGSPISQSDAATGNDWATSPEGVALTSIYDNFEQYEDRGAFQSNDPDCINATSLYNASGDGRTSISDPAKYLLSDPALLANLNITSGGTGFTREALAQYIAAKETGSSQQQSPGSNSSSGTNGSQNTTTAAEQGGMNATAANCHPRAFNGNNVFGLESQLAKQAQAGGTSSAASGGQSSSGPFSQAALDRLDSLDNTISQMTQQGDLSPSDQLKLQHLMEQEKEMFSMMSNISKMYDDMAMTAINNMR